MFKKIGIISILISLFLISCSNTFVSKKTENDNKASSVNIVEAKKIATTNAGINVNDVVFVKTNQDYNVDKIIKLYPAVTRAYMKEMNLDYNVLIKKPIDYDIIDKNRYALQDALN